MRLQTTLERTICLAGVGLHSGETARVRLHPAPAFSGIRIRRRGNAHTLPARADAAQELAFATRIGARENTVSTVEHLLGALAGCGVENAVIEVDGPEIPIMDGSAWPFVRLIERSGIRTLDEEGSRLKILEPIEVREDDRLIRIEPASTLSVDYTISFENPLVGYQRFVGPLDPVTFKRAIAPARTFGFLKDVNYLKSKGLGQGGTLENCVVVHNDEVLSGHLRYIDEFVRHKVLDLIGDLSLLEYPLLGKIIAERAGHALHVALVRTILGAPERWRIVGGHPRATLDPFPLETELTDVSML